MEYEYDYRDTDFDFSGGDPSGYTPSSLPAWWGGQEYRLGEEGTGTPDRSWWKDLDWGRGFSSIGRGLGQGTGSVLSETIRGLAPGLGYLAAASGAQRLFPGTPQKVISPDVRTPEAVKAEGYRNTAAERLLGLAEQERGPNLDEKFEGLTPREEQRIKSRVRAADAARGMSETGHSAVREREALEDASLKRELAFEDVKLRKEGLRSTNRRDLYSSLIGATGGYQPRGLQHIPGEENPWARILTDALAPGMGNTFGKLYNKWWA